MFLHPKISEISCDSGSKFVPTIDLDSQLQTLKMVSSFSVVSERALCNEIFDLRSWKSNDLDTVSFGPLSTIPFLLAAGATGLKSVVIFG